MLAIVIPYYKFNFFEETLTSLANQTNKNFRVYIGNDASPDDPEDLINSFADRLNITYKRFEQNLGGISLTGQWDRCMEMIQEEEWIMILGDDDLTGTNVVKSWYEAYCNFNQKTSLVRFSTRLIDSESNFTSSKFIHPKWEKETDSFYRRFSGKTRSSLSEHVFRKSTYLKHGFFDFPLGWHSDDYAWLEYSEGSPIYSINEAIIYIRNSEMNISGRTDNEGLKNQAEIEFFSYLFYRKLNEFKKDCRLIIMHKFEFAIRKRRSLSLIEYYYLFYNHFRNYNKKNIIKLSKRFLRAFYY